MDLDKKIDSLIDKNFEVFGVGNHIYYKTKNKNDVKFKKQLKDLINETKTKS